MTEKTTMHPPAETLHDNKDVFLKSEFGLWSDREGFEPGEQFLIENYLRPDLKTLEAGCGGGRLLLAMQARGYTDLHGFDYLPQFVEAASRRDTAGRISFRVQDARSLDYGDDSFDQLMYLQQVLCFLPEEADRQRAAREAYRVLRPGGVLIVTLLGLRGRTRSLAFKALLAYQYLLRKLTFRRLSLQYQPWLRLQNAPNWSALWDRGPYVYWFREPEAVELFTNAGFELAAIGSEAQVCEGRLAESFDAFARLPHSGRLYIVCRKPIDGAA
ncbi:MAG: class I SAM-dependent methyltransferase [Planctomycetia bacterium]|nr:class I SAM-dependent methyltransferase [Planctomycetia bacterium]